MSNLPRVVGVDPLVDGLTIPKSALWLYVFYDAGDVDCKHATSYQFLYEGEEPQSPNYRGYECEVLRQRWTEENQRPSIGPPRVVDVAAHVDGIIIPDKAEWLVVGQDKFQFVMPGGTRDASLSVIAFIPCADLRRRWNEHRVDTVIAKHEDLIVKLQSQLAEVVREVQALKEKQPQEKKHGFPARFLDQERERINQKYHIDITPVEFDAFLTDRATIVVCAPGYATLTSGQDNNYYIARSSQEVRMLVRDKLPNMSYIKIEASEYLDD